MCGEEGRRKKMQEGSRDRSGRIGGRRGGRKEGGGGGRWKKRETDEMLSTAVSLT